jgi:replication fork protection complex subunit Csm3/Swi3
LDTARLLSLYQLWLDDLFPKAKFLDALAMIEKTGHTRRVRLARMDMINEGRPRSSMPDFDDAELFGETEEQDAANAPTRIAHIFEQGNKQGDRPTTPDVEDLLGGDDIYGATPRAARTSAQNSAAGQGNDAPDDEEDLDALMAEEEANRNAPVSIFGNGQTKQRPPPRMVEPDEDDLDALMAEAEAEISSAPKKAPEPTSSKPNPPAMDDDFDDLDALMAEVEGAVPASKPEQQKAPEAPSGGPDGDEVAMVETVEMDGLW